MPISKSAKKSLKVSRTKAEANHKREVLLSKALKQVNEKNVSEAIAIVDKAAKTGIIHKNKAARIKSQLTKKYGTPKVSPKSKVESLPAGKAGKKSETKETETKAVKSKTKKATVKKSVPKKTIAKPKTTK